MLYVCCMLYVVVVVVVVVVLVLSSSLHCVRPALGPVSPGPTVSSEMLTHFVNLPFYGPSQTSGRLLFVSSSLACKPRIPTLECVRLFL
jgi:uncharacterized membrane protein